MQNLLTWTGYLTVLRNYKCRYSPIQHLMELIQQMLPYFYDLTGKNDGNNSLLDSTVRSDMSISML